MVVNFGTNLVLLLLFVPLLLLNLLRLFMFDLRAVAGAGAGAGDGVDAVGGGLLIVISVRYEAFDMCYARF
jgi:hypothetical protein